MPAHSCPVATVADAQSFAATASPYSNGCARGASVQRRRHLFDVPSCRWAGSTRPYVERRHQGRHFDGDAGLPAWLAGEPVLRRRQLHPGQVPATEAR